MNERRSDASILPLKVILRLLETGYSSVIAIRNLLYDKNIFKRKGVPCRVVSIGNITVGGTGKTPLVIMTARMLLDAGLTVAVVSRGYGGRSRKPVVVSDGTDVLASPPEAGDEPLIIAQALPNIPVVIGKDRYKAALLAYERFKPKVIVLDDAMQHRRLMRTVDVVTLDAASPLGNGHLLPRGILRESPHALSRADVVIVTRFHDKLRRDAIERMIRYYNSRIPVFWSKHIPVCLRTPGSTDTLELTAISGKKIAALSNIANPESFFRMLESLVGEIVLKHAVPDHHRYTNEELKQNENKACSAGAEMIVMTAKDEQNLPEKRFKGIIKKYVLDIEAKLIGDIKAYIKIISQSGMNQK